MAVIPAMQHRHISCIPIIPLLVRGSTGFLLVRGITRFFSMTCPDFLRIPAEEAQHQKQQDETDGQRHSGMQPI
jgi:hypothetical protein